MRRPLSSLPTPLSLVLLALLTLAASAPAQDASPASGFTVRGTVVNAVTGQPVPRALVSLDQQTAALTDGDGHFSFDDTPPGEYGLSVSKPDFQGYGRFTPGRMVRMARGSVPPRPETPLRIQVGPDMAPLSIHITPLAMITGHVTLSTADPADGIRVQVFARRFVSGRPHWTVAGETRTRSDGSFRLAGLEPGTYVVATLASLDRPGSLAGNRGPLWGYPSLYYPGTTDFSGAGVLTVGAGQQAEADLTLVRQQFFPVLALLHAPTEAFPNFEILDSGGRTTGLSANWDRREGVVHAAVPNGTWTLEAHVYGHVMQWGSTTFQVNGAPVSLAIAVLPVPHIPIIVHREFLASADNSQPEPVLSGPSVNITLTNADEMGSLTVGGGMAPTEGSDGTQWELQVAQPGRYWVQVEGFPPAYVSSATSGGVDLGSNPLTVLPGSTPAPVEVTLRNDSGTITGQINGLTGSAGPTPAAGQQPTLWIYAIPLFATAGTVHQGSLQPTGQFSIPVLAPGSWRVVACDQPQDIDFHSPEGLAAWAGKGQTVTVDPGGSASVDLDVVHITAENQ